MPRAFAVLTDGATVEVWSNLADQPGRVGQFPVADGVVAVAINKDGAAAASTGGGQILGFTGSNSSLVASGGTWTAIAFSGGDLIAADSSAGELVRFADALHSPARSLIEKLTGVVSIAISRDGLSAAVGFAEDLALVNLSGGIAPISCNCQSKSLNALEGNLVLQLAGVGDRTLILDADGADARVIQLPGVSASAAVAGESAQ